MKFVHAADIHLDSPLQALVLHDEGQIARMRGATRSAFERLIDLCIDQEVAFLVLAGDLYDHDSPNMQIAVFLRNQLARLEKKGIRVVIAKGNHDADNKITSALALPGNTRILSDQQPEIIRYDDLSTKIAIHGQSFKPGPINENLASFYPAALKGYLNIGVLHTSLGGNTDHDPYAPCQLEELTTRGYAYWALGHIHKGAVLSQAPWVVYPGNLQGRHAKETGPKGCFLVEVEDGQIISAELVALDVIRWHQAEVDLHGKNREPELIEGIRAALVKANREADDRPTAVRLILKGRTQLHDAMSRKPKRLHQTVLELAGEIGGDDIWIEKVRDDTSPPEMRVEGKANEGIGDLFQIMHEIANDTSRVGSLLEKELESLRTKLPEELKELPALEIIDDPGLARTLLIRLEPRLRSRLDGEEDSS